MAQIDEHALTTAAAFAHVEIPLLRRVITENNKLFANEKKTASRRQIDFSKLIGQTMLEFDAIDLLLHDAYKSAVGKYYSLRRATPPTLYPLRIETSNSMEARIRVSNGVSIVFRALNSKGVLTQREIEYRHHIIHSRKDVRDSDVMSAARKLALAAINAIRKPKRTKKAA